MLAAIKIIIALGVVIYLINQCRKPHGWLGRFFLWEMGGRHAGVTDWGLSHIKIERSFTVLDIGCGGGRTVAKLAAATSGQVFGVDYSAASVKASGKRNRQLITEGRVEIRQASVSQLPFSDRMFDLVTAVETHYYWPDLASDLREILRVLKPGGQLIIIAEAYKRSRFDPTQAVMKMLRAAYFGAAEHRELFERAGYTSVQVLEDRRKGWICAIGTRPLDHADHFNT
jgi:ubiquinone/menaquinone biosynthesis C-methylase UbiE